MLLNHLLVGVALVMARGVSWQQSRILALDFLSVEVAILLMGYVTAILWSITLALILLGFVGTLLVYQAFCVPLVKKYA